MSAILLLLFVQEMTILCKFIIANHIYDGVVKLKFIRCAVVI